MKGLVRKIFSAPFAIRRIENKLDDLLLLNARNYLKSFDSTAPLPSIRDAEFKVFSQWGDDGIIQYLIRRLNTEVNKFIEFGVENYRESNTRFLLMNNNWKGLIFDGSAKNIAQIKKDELYWKYDLTAEAAFITRDNIRSLIQNNGFAGKLGLLHIDIDGNDYWVWEAIDNVVADIVIMEYNAYFGNERAITIPYDPAFDAFRAHYSRLYFGASLPALIHLAQAKGYFHVGCNTGGNNAYFVKREYADRIKELSAKEGFVMPASRQSRDSRGQLSYLGAEQAAQLIEKMPVVNVISGQTEYL